MEDRASGAVGTTNELQFNELLIRLYRVSINNNYALAVWRLPNDGKIKLIVDVSGKADLVKTDLEELGQGFVFSPFSNLDNSSACFIQNNIELTQGGEVVFSEKVGYGEKNRLIKELAGGTTKENRPVSSFYTSVNIPSITLKEDYCTSVEKAVGSFEEGNFQKVVLSRCNAVGLSESFDVIESFYGLCEAYPNAFVSITSIPDVGTWIGASPEILISVDKNKIFRTAAVAGTQLFRDEIDLAEVAWRQKDIEEQAMVSRYIINCFKKIRLREFEEIGPRTARAGNVVHLKTDFHIDMQEVNFPQLGTVMISLLHPTSAVCGVPRDTALDFIDQYENYDRSFYSGFLGPVNMDGESHLYVNIRCMQLFQNQAYLYGGAGVTRESKPEKEWEETEIKINTLMDLLTKMGFVRP